MLNLNSIRLFKNDLSGSIPSSLQNLKHLEFLFIEDNSFSGEVSDQIKMIKNLKHFNYKNKVKDQ